MPQRVAGRFLQSHALKRGASDAAKVRAETAQTISQTLQEYGFYRVKVSPDNSKVKASYQYDERDSGDDDRAADEYSDTMFGYVQRAEKTFAKALAPYRAKLEDVEVYSGEKGWVFVEVKLK